MISRRASPTAAGVSRTGGPTVRLRPQPGSAAGLRLVTAADESEFLDITVDVDARQLVADRDRASLDTRAYKGRYTVPLHGAVAEDGAVELRAVVDGSIVEIFLSNGQTMTLRWYPTGGHAWRLHARGTGHYAVDAWGWGVRTLMSVRGMPL